MAARARRPLPRRRAADRRAHARARAAKVAPEAARRGEARRRGRARARAAALDPPRSRRSHRRREGVSRRSLRRVPRRVSRRGESPTPTTIASSSTSVPPRTRPATSGRPPRPSRTPSRRGGRSGGRAELLQPRECPVSPRRSDPGHQPAEHGPGMAARRSPPPRRRSASTTPMRTRASTATSSKKLEGAGEAASTAVPLRAAVAAAIAPRISRSPHRVRRRSRTSRQSGSRAEGLRPALSFPGATPSARRCLRPPPAEGTARSQIEPLSRRERRGIASREAADGRHAGGFRKRKRAATASLGPGR